MELPVSLTIEYQFIGTHQTEWSPKPQHLWTYQLSVDDSKYDKLLPYLFLTVNFPQGQSCGDYYYLLDKHTLRFQCLTHKYNQSPLQFVFQKDLNMPVHIEHLQRLQPLKFPAQHKFIIKMIPLVKLLLERQKIKP